MEQMHSLLKRQLRRCFGDPFYIPEEWQAFIGAVNTAYREFDADRGMLERALDLSSQELLQANSEMRAIFKAIPDLLFRLDSQGTILDYEAGGTTHFFLQPKELLGKRIQEVPLKHVGDKFREAIHQVRETKSVVSVEYSLLIQDQRHFYEARLLPLLENQIIVIIRNITERKQAEQVRAAIYRISEAAQAAQNLDQLFGSIHAIIAELMPARNFYIALYDASADLIHYPYYADEFDVTPSPHKLSSGLTDYVLRTGKPLLATPQVFEQLVQSGRVGLLGAPSVDWLGVPLKTQRGEMIGVMAVQTYTEAVRLGEADKDILVFVSTQVAMVIERKRAEEQIRKLNRTLQVINQVNESLVHATEEAELLQRVCQIIVDVGGYHLAWVGFAEQDDAQTVRPVASAGHDEGYLDTTNITWADTERGRGLSGTAIRTGQPALAGNILTDPHYAPWREQALQRGYASSIALPLLSHGLAFGAIQIYASEPEAFDAEEIELLTEMAEDLAYGIVALRTRAEHQRAVEKIKQLNQDLERRARGLAALNQASQIMASTLDLDTLLRRVIEQVRSLLNVEGVSVLLCSPSSNETSLPQDKRSELVFAAVTGPRAETLVGTRLPIAAGIAGWVMRETQPALVADVQNDPRFYHRIDAATGMTTRSLLAVPLVSKGSAQGVIEAINKTMGTFDQQDLQVLEALGSSAAIAIENARLFEAERLARERAEALREAITAVGGSLDLTQVLRLILGQLKRVLIYDTASVLLLGEAGEPALVAGIGYADEKQTSQAAGDLLRASPILSQMARDLEPVRIADVRGHPGWIWVPGAEHVCSFLGVPIVARQRMIGALMVDNSRPNFFTEADVRTAQLLAQHIAIAIENARLYAIEQQRAAALAHALEQQRKLDQLQREFIQNVSHELRTPLALVRGHAEVLENGWLGDMQPEQKESVSVIVRRAQMLTALVNDIISALEIERRELVREPIDLETMVRTCLTEFRAAAEKAEVILGPEIAPGLPLVSGDPLALRRVLDNLVGNALKFTPASGRVTVRLYRSEETVRLEVADAGIGIPSEHLAHIFERFYQVDGSASRKYGGMGLGLALVKEVVEAHGGQVAVESKVGQGSTFTVTLPIRTQ